MASAISPSRKRLFPRLRPSTRLVLIVAAVVAAGYYGWNYLGSYWILHQHFAEIKPGNVSLIGIKNNGQFKIVVANRIAQLVEAKDGHLGNDEGGGGGEGGETEGAVKKRIPIKEMLGALKGDEKDLSLFVAKLNDLAPDENWPTVRIVWKAEDIRKALDGDPVMSKKLMDALNVDFKGSGLPYLSVSALENGIIVDVPVKVRVRVGAEQKELIARIQRPFIPTLMKAVSNEYKEKASVTKEMMMGYYLLHKSKDTKQDIRKSLESLIAPASLKDEVQRAEDVLSSAMVVVNEGYIDKASYDSAPIGGQHLFNMILHVTEDGRQRLWQYSKLHPGDQLLLVSDGVAIAAPRIRHDLWTSDFEISQMPDEVLVQDAVNSINAAHR